MLCACSGLILINKEDMLLSAVSTSHYILCYLAIWHHCAQNERLSSSFVLMRNRRTLEGFRLFVCWGCCVFFPVEVTPRAVKPCDTDLWPHKSHCDVSSSDAPCGKSEEKQSSLNSQQNMFHMGCCHSIDRFMSGRNKSGILIMQSGKSASFWHNNTNLVVWFNIVESKRNVE